MELTRFIQKVTEVDDGLPFSVFVTPDNLMAGGQDEGKYYSANTTPGETASFRTSFIRGEDMQATHNGLGFVVGSVAVVLGTDGDVFLNSYKATKIKV